MDTAAFLQKILPTTGIRFLAEWVLQPTNPRGGFLAHYPYGDDDLDVMVAKCASITAAGRDTYFACASFKEVIYKTSGKGFEFPAGREQNNVHSVKAFWLDMDVGKDDPTKCYPTQREAAIDVARLVKEVGLPQPMLVSSGAGLHVYWPLTENIDGKRWLAIASQLKSTCSHLGVKADPSRTADSASVLRPIGTMNPKHGKPVRLLKDAAPVGAGLISGKLADFIIANHVSHTRRDAAPASSRNFALMGTHEVEYPPSHADHIIQSCAVLANFHDKLGNVNEPFWYAAIGLLKHCVDGEKIIHEWSAGHPDYEAHVTQNKIEQWTVGPPLCKKLASESGLGVCETCPKHGKVSTPLQLGYTMEPAQEIEIPASVTSAGIGIEMSKVKLPAGYMWTNGSLQRMVVDKDGDESWLSFSDTLFIVTNRVRAEDGTWNLRVKMSVAGHYWREFELPQMLIPDPRGLARHLAKYEVVIFGITHAMEYIRTYSRLLRELDLQVTTYARFGWDEGKFIVGSTAFTPDGNTEPVLVTDNVVNSGKSFDSEPTGDLATWVDLLDQAYNRPCAEKYQFVIAAAFASPMVSLFNLQNYRGIPIVLSGEGGSGKSSVCEAAATIYGDPKALMTNAGSEGGATLNSLFALASMYNGVPLLFDEITERDSKDFVPLMYTLSNGICKSRMTSGGKFAETAPPFAGIYFGTANVNVTDMLYDAAKKDVSDATSARCFEIGGLTKSEMLATFAGTNMKDLLEHKLFSHRGVAARVFLPHLIKNSESIRERVLTLRGKLGGDIDGDSRERFYIDTIAFAHVAATVAKKLGLIKWDVNVMTKWAIAHIKSLRRSFMERSALSEDNISVFLGWLYGRTIVTRNFPRGKTRQEDVEMVMDQLRHAPCARIATKDRRMFVTSHAVAEWCKDHNQVVEKFRDQLKRENYIIAESQEYLGKGTNLHTGRSRCMEFNYSKIVGSTDVEVVGNVARIIRPEEVQHG